MTHTPIRSADHCILPLPPEQIWPVLADVSRYPQWWPKALCTSTSTATADLLGAELKLRPLGGYSFTCRVVAFEQLKRINFEYGGGFIAGTSAWRLEPAGQGTRVVYDIDVVVNSRLASLVHRAINLGRVHSFSMQIIFRNLRRELFKPAARA